MLLRGNDSNAPSNLKASGLISGCAVAPGLREAAGVDVFHRARWRWADEVAEIQGNCVHDLKSNLAQPLTSLWTPPASFRIRWQSWLLGCHV